MNAPRVPLSILDLVPISQGMTTTEGFNESLRLAELADEAGYHRYWYAEHHNTDLFASSATSLLIGRAADHTKRIRLGSGGVMLPNHAPLMVAEYYGTLAEMYGDRIDLGLGRAPGTDPRTAAALRRGHPGGDTFIEDIVELHDYLTPGAQHAPQGPVLGWLTRPVPLWILGSSLNGAAAAAFLGLPYAFASHFAPQLRHEAIALYRERFSTDFQTAQIAKPYVMAGVNVLVAPTDAEANYLFTTSQQMAASIATGRRGPLPAPVDDITAVIPPQVRGFVEEFGQVRAVGSPETAVRQLEQIVADLGLDEVIITTYTHDPKFRARSFELLAQAWFNR